MDFNLKQLARRARYGKLEGVRLEAGTLIVTPHVSDVPTAAKDLKAEISEMYPLIDVPDLLREVHEWTAFGDQFTHVRTGDAPQNIAAMLAGVLADGTNLGPKRMAGASKGSALTRSAGCAASTLAPKPTGSRRPAWPMLIRVARIQKSGATAPPPHPTGNSSAPATAAVRGDINLHYGSEPGMKFYSALSDQYGYFSILPISPTESEAVYVLDGLFDHDTVLDIEELFTDTGGASDQLFGLFPIVNRRFSPLAQSQGSEIPYIRKGRYLSGVGQAHRRADQYRSHPGALG